MVVAAVVVEVAVNQHHTVHRIMVRRIMVHRTLVHRAVVPHIQDKLTAQEPDHRIPTMDGKRMAEGISTIRTREMGIFTIHHRLQQIGDRHTTARRIIRHKMHSAHFNPLVLVKELFDLQFFLDCTTAVPSILHSSKMKIGPPPNTFSISRNFNDQKIDKKCLSSTNLRI